MGLGAAVGGGRWTGERLCLGRESLQDFDVHSLSTLFVCVCVYMCMCVYATSLISVRPSPHRTGFRLTMPICRTDARHYYFCNALLHLGLKLVFANYKNG